MKEDAKSAKKDEGIRNQNYRYIQELKEAYQNKTLVVFFGAGLSMPLGLPRWEGLIKHVINTVIESPKEREKCLKRTERGDFWEAMEHVKDHAKVSEETIKGIIARYIKDCQEKNEESLSTLNNNYCDLAESDVALFLTTNYDTYLERACGQYKTYEINRLEKSVFADVLQANDGVKRIIHLHGSVDDEKTIIITKEGVETIYKNETWISLFQTLLNSYHILLIGISLEDKYLKEFLENSKKISKNDYYILANKDVDFPCKKIVIPNDYSKRVGSIQKIIADITKVPKEAIWVRIKVEFGNKETVIEYISKQLKKDKGIKFEIINTYNEKYVIFFSIHMKKSISVDAACERYRDMVKRYQKKKNISLDMVCFYSSNTENFTKGSTYSKVHLNYMLQLLEGLVTEDSQGVIVDRIELEANNSSNVRMLEKYHAVRGTINLGDGCRGRYQQKEYSLYVDEGIVISGAKDYGVEVHVSGFCFFNDKVLMESRKRTSAIASGMIAPIGGRMQPEENFWQALVRHFRDDCRYKIGNIRLLNIFTTYNANVPGVAFVCNFVGVEKGKSGMRVQSELYTEEQLLELKKEGKLACTEELLREAFIKHQEIRKKSIKLRIVLWSNCCYNCQGCHHENVTDISMVHSSKKIIETLIKLGQWFDIRQITITGGEPLMEPGQLEDILKVIKKGFPLSDVAIITNAEFLKETIINQYKKYNVRYKISLYGYDNASFRAYTRCDRYRETEYLDTFLGKLKMLNEMKVNYTINIPIHKYLIEGIRTLYENELVQNYLLEQKAKIKLIDMVNPRNGENSQFRNLYVPVGEAKLRLESNIDRDSEGVKALLNRTECFVYPCKECNGDNENCFENFALTLEPNGKLLVCKNAIKNIAISGIAFKEYLESQGIVVDEAEYNIDYGMDNEAFKNMDTERKSTDGIY